MRHLGADFHEFHDFVHIIRKTVFALMATLKLGKAGCIRILEWYYYLIIHN